MAMDMWKAGPETQKMMIDLINQYHPSLVLIQDEIVIIFREKASASNGQVCLGKTKKAPPSLALLTDKNYQYRFVIELAGDQWNTLNDTQRMALIDHHLCSIVVEEDANSGEIKCSIRQPDFTGFKDEVARWGMWRPLDDETLTAVEKMFEGAAKDAPKKRSRAAGDAADIIDNAMN